MIDCEDDERWRGHESLWIDILKRDGDSWTLLDLARGAELDQEQLLSCDGIVLTGSHHSATDASLPWRAALIEFLQEAVAEAGDSKPRILAVCFSCQLLAHALGGEAGPNPDRTFVLGAEPLTIIPSLAQHVFPQASHTMTPRVLQCHGDCVLSLPPRATLLAASPSCKHELYCIGDQGEGSLFWPHGNSLIPRLHVQLLLSKDTQSLMWTK